MLRRLIGRLCKDKIIHVLISSLYFSTVASIDFHRYLLAVRDLFSCMNLQERHSTCFEDSFLFMLHIYNTQPIFISFHFFYVCCRTTTSPPYNYFVSD